MSEFHALCETCHRYAMSRTTAVGLPPLAEFSALGELGVIARVAFEG